MKSIKIDEETHKELKVFCAKNEMPLSLVVSQGVTMYMVGHNKIEKELKAASKLKSSNKK